MAKQKPGKLDIRSIESHLEQSSKRTNEPPIGFGGRPPNARAYFVNKETTGDNEVKRNFVLPVKSPKSPLKTPQLQSPPVESSPVQSPIQPTQIKTPTTPTTKPKAHVNEPEMKTQKEEQPPVKIKKEGQKSVQNEGLMTINAPPKRTIPLAASVFDDSADANKAHEQEDDLVTSSNKERNGGNLYEVTILPSEAADPAPISPSEMSPDTTQDDDSNEECIYDNIINLTAHLHQGIPNDSSDEEGGIKREGLSEPENELYITPVSGFPRLPPSI